MCLHPMFLDCTTIAPTPTFLAVTALPLGPGSFSPDCLWPLNHRSHPHHAPVRCPALLPVSRPPQVGRPEAGA
eukprot:6024978-Pleurochrysis_carterae.AAC.1